MAEKLKPCPCCGGYPAIYGVATDTGLVWRLRVGVGEDGKAKTEDFATREAAHIAWNRRVSNDESKDNR